MEKRVRSPNYPAFGLGEALQKAALLYKNQHTHGAPREVVVKSMGYSSLNGASATAISALMKYGLLEGRGEEIRISDRAMRILHPQNDAEKRDALLEAATDPELFQELQEKFPGRPPTEEVLRNYLIRRGFAPAALGSVILAYRETNELLTRELGGYDSANHTLQAEAGNMQLTGHAPIVTVAPVVKKIEEIQRDETVLGYYQFTDGPELRISLRGETGNVDLEEALSMAETLIELKRKEIARRNARRPVATDRSEKISE